VDDVIVADIFNFGIVDTYTQGVVDRGILIRVGL